MRPEWTAGKRTPAAPHRVVEDAASDAPLPGGIDADLALSLYREMVFLRVFDERLLVFHRTGRIGASPLSWGHEAIQVGVMRALRATDWAFPSYREDKIACLRGMPISTVLAAWRGHPEGFFRPNAWRVASIAVPVGSQIPHAAGLALGEKLQGRDTVSAVFFGDGATSEGDFHEGANFAAVMEAPVVLVCTNNQWAVSTPVHMQTRAPSLADKAIGYGIPSLRVDGNDVLAVYQAASDAVARARAGGGPSLLECLTYRVAAHATPDDPNAYRPEAESEEARRHECVERLGRYLRARGILTDEEATRAREDALGRLTAAIAEAEAHPPPDPSVVFDFARSEPTPAMRADLAELLDVRTRYGAP